MVNKKPGEPAPAAAVGVERFSSGGKYVTPQGFTAIRDGIKTREGAAPAAGRSGCAQAALAQGPGPLRGGLRRRPRDRA